MRGRQGRVEVAPQDHPHVQPRIGDLDRCRDGPLERLALARIDVFEAPGHASDLGLRRLRIGGILLVEDRPLHDAAFSWRGAGCGAGRRRRSLPSPDALVDLGIGRAARCGASATGVSGARSSGLSRHRKAKAAMAAITSARTEPNMIVRARPLLCMAG